MLYFEYIMLKNEIRILEMLVWSKFYENYIENKFMRHVVESAIATWQCYCSLRHDNSTQF